MACRFEIAFPWTGSGPAQAAALQALEVVDQVEREISYYRPDSELSRLNRLAGSQPVATTPRLFHLLQLAESVYRETAGAYDLTSTPLSDCWGFLQREPRVPSESSLRAALARVGMHRVQLAERTGSVSFSRPDLEINTNSLGKGFALDEAAAAMREHSISNALLHGGGSSAVALGSCSDVRGWQVEVRHPGHHDRPLARVFLRDSGFSTSGAEEQGFEADGKRYGHLIDPRTGYPADGMLSVSVAAPTATLAEALSTAFFVMGTAATQAYCANHADVRALLVPEAGAGQAAETLIVGFQPDEMEVLT
jgi:thiamine biosynthesis lipoprotein